jgi:hypothetical protein
MRKAFSAPDVKCCSEKCKNDWHGTKEGQDLQAKLDAIERNVRKAESEARQKQKKSSA